MTTNFRFTNSPISCHALNSSCTEAAVQGPDNTVHIYRLTKSGGSKHELCDILSEHTCTVTGIDWSPVSNRIVTCSADRNAYVWTKQPDGKWKPTLVILQINRAATCVRWSPLGNKFAVGSAARMISVCYFEEDNDWWVSKHIKKPIRSTVTSLDWHPNNVLLACGSTDFKARVFSAFLKTVDEKPAKTSWGEKMTFANLMYEVTNGGGSGWVHGVSFSADGEKLAWVAHDSSISVVDAGQGMALAVLRHTYLPFTSLSWVGKSTLLAAGHDCCPMVFTYSGPGQLQFSKQIDTKSEAKAAKMTAMQKFQEYDKKATTEDSGTQLNTLHQNMIKEVRIIGGSKNLAERISTVGKDGQMVFWDLRTLEQRIAGLKIE